MNEIGRTFMFTAVIGIVFFTAEYYNFFRFLPYEKWYILAFFFTVSLLQHRIMSFGFQENRERFVQFYLVTAVLRLILCVLFVGFFLYYKVNRPAAFVITFFVLYLFYTFFEVLGLYRNLRRDLKP
ncbi:MAG: hypothetical protein U0X91_29360 [Spirosomataceae bacterium]